MIDVTLPQLGESVSEGTVTKWLVREGDFVQKDQPLVEIGTDKADSELPAPSAGRVTQILAKEGETLAVNAVLCRLDETVQASAAPQAAPAAPSSDVRAPAPAPVPAPPSAPAAVVQRPPASSPSLAAAAGLETVSSRSVTGGTLATPTARKAALENEVNLESVQGSGERGRITRDDVLRAAATNGPQAVAPQAPAPAPVAPPPPAPAPARAPAAALSQLINQGGGFVPPIPGLGYGSFKVPAYKPNEGDKVVPFTRRRRITADHMTYSKFASPHVVTVAEIDLNKVSQLRDAHKDRYKKEGHALTMLAFVVVAVARALRENMALNARVLDDAYVVMKDINIGVAVDSPDGLVVPVIRRADELGVRGIVRGIDELAKRARGGKITVDDLSGATFSVTNPGLKGNLFGGAIINQPNVGILRMGEIQKRVVVVEGPGGEDVIAIHPVMYAALSYDHRIVDGVAANNFLWRVADVLEKGEFEV
ncbi:2-oxo acid dehydrogenase subunit E2 [Pendulispora brunnea]|uniref:Dihydrolipoamide acetyltransferase component of pyruvate dehydrogenase complex n=1 Tax=Pendulispora brunnea TaxID=2905690 RepID=A0ABZ2K236_9BACT